MNLLALWVTLKLAAIVAVLLMIVGLPLAIGWPFPAGDGGFCWTRWWPCRWCCRRLCSAFTCWWPWGRKARSGRGIRSRRDIRWRSPLKDWLSVP
jgi:hypothetical protein